MNITILHKTLSTFRIEEREGLLKEASEGYLYETSGVMHFVENGVDVPAKVANLTLDDKPYLDYLRNWLPQSAIKDGKATLELTPGEKYVLIRYWTETEGEELISKQEVVGTYTASVKIGKVSITGLDDTSLYKLATAETAYTPAYEDVFTEEGV